MIEAKSKQISFLISVAFALLMSKLDSSIVNISLPVIAKYFGIDTGPASWVVMSYLLVLTCMLLFFGKLCDLINIKRFFITGYTIFVLGSLMCGFAPSIHVLIFSRVLQALGGAILNIAAYALVAKFIPENRLGWAFGILAAVNALGVSIGAPLGGLITTYLSWQWIFFINVPIGVIAIFQAVVSIPKSQPPVKKKIKIDYIGTVLSAAAMLCLLLALNTGDDYGWLSPRICVLFAASVLLVVLFVIVEKKVSSPLLNLKLFKNTGFTLTVLATVFGLMILSGNSFLMPFYLETVKHLRADTVGFLMLCFTLVFLFTSSVFAGRAGERFTLKKVCIAAILAASCTALYFAFTLHSAQYIFIVSFLVLLGVALGFFMPSNNNQIMRTATPETKGEISGVLNTAINLSFTLGVCLFEMIYSKAVIPVDGFEHAYIFGSIICFISFCLLAVSLRYKSKC